MNQAGCNHRAGCKQASLQLPGKLQATGQAALPGGLQPAPCSSNQAPHYHRAPGCHLVTGPAATIGQAANRQAPNYWASCKQPGQLELLGGLQPAPRSRNRAPGCHPDGPTRLHSSGGAATQATSTTHIYSNCPTHTEQTDSHTLCTLSAL